MSTEFSPVIRRYIKHYEKALRVLPIAEQKECVNELKSQIYDCLHSGETEQSILDRLGKASDYAQPFVQEHLREIRAAPSLLPHLRLIKKQVFAPCFILLLVFTILYLANTLYIFSGIISSAEDAILIGLFSLPAIFVVTLPMLVLWMVPLYVFKLGKNTPAKTLKSFRVWAVTLFIGLSTSGLSFLVQDLIVPRANIETVESMKRSMERKSGGPINFQNLQDVRVINFREAYLFLDGKPKTKVVKQQLRDYYTKFSLPLLNLVCACFGLLTASLMLSGIFHPIYTLFSIGTVFPLVVTYFVWSLVDYGNLGQFYDVFKSPLLQAFLPNIILFSIALLFLIGLALPYRASLDIGSEAYYA